MTLSTADQALFSYAIPGILREFDIGLDVVGLLLSASFAVAAFTVVIAGALTDRLGRVRVFAILLAASGACVGLHAFAANLSLLALFRILGFALAAGMYPITSTIVLEATPDRYRGVLAGLLQLAYPLGFFLGSMLATTLIDSHGWRSIFYPAFGVILVAVWIGRSLHEPEAFVALQKDRAALGQQAESKLRFSMLFRGKWRNRAIVCIVASAVLNISIGGFTFFIPTFLTEAKSLSDSDAAGLSGMTYLIGALGYVLSSYVGQYVLTRRNTLVIFIWLGAVFYGAAIWFGESSLSLTFLLGMTVVFLFGSEAVRMPLVGELFPTELRATASAAAGAVGVTLGLLMAPLLIGYLVPQIGWYATLSITGVVPLLFAGALFLLLENRKSDAELEEFF
jgi:MFS family permease